MNLALELGGAFLGGFAVALILLLSLVYRQLRARGLWPLIVAAARSSKKKPPAVFPGDYLRGVEAKARDEGGLR